MTRRLRDWVLAGSAAIGVAVITAWWSAPQGGAEALAVADPVQRSLAPSASNTAAAAVPPATAGREPWPQLPTQALRAWGGPAPAARPRAAVAALPPSTVVPPPAAPTPPPLTWRYVGRIVEGGRARAILVHSAQGTAVVGASDLVEGQWRVEGIREDAVDLLWLPGGVRQRLVAPT